MESGNEKVICPRCGNDTYYNASTLIGIQNICCNGCGMPMLEKIHPARLAVESSIPVASLAEKLGKFVKSCNRAWIPGLTREKLNAILFNISDLAATLLTETPSTVINEFEEKCWKDAIEVTWNHVHLLPNGGATIDRKVILERLKKNKG